MYSVVLATMIAAGSTTPAWHNHHRSSCYSCYSCSSCYSCYSCYSGYSGYSGYAGYCHSCHGCYRSYCSGCYGCSISYSSCYSSCYSGCYCSGPVYYYGCCGGVVTQPQVIEVPAKKPAEKVPDPKKTGGDSEQTTSRVTIVVPADARVWVENVECPLTSAVRSFNTPALNPNQQYAYNIKMEVVRDGRTVSQTQRAVITPGQPVQVDFTAGATATAAR